MRLSSVALVGSALLLNVCSCAGTATEAPRVPVVQVVISPATTRITIGQTQAFSAVALDAGAQPLVGRAISWSVQNPSIASVSSTGVVAALRPGQTQVTAQVEGKSGSALVDAVDQAPAQVMLTPASNSIVPGQSVTLSATVKDATGAVTTGWALTWKSSNTAVATVDGAGMVTGAALGVATITATAGAASGTATFSVQASVGQVRSVTVSPANTTIPLSGSTTFTAVVEADPGMSTAVTWRSSDTGKATVSSSGLAFGVAVGTGISICATSVADTSKQACGALTITAANASTMLMLPQAITMLLGQYANVDVTRVGQPYSYYTWSSSNSTVATVNGGSIHAISPGTARVSATTDGEIVSANVNVITGTEPVRGVTVSPPAAVLALGTSLQLSATVTADEGVPQTVTWTSGAPARATVSSTGLVTAVSATQAVPICATSTAAPERMGCTTLLIGSTNKVVIVQPTELTLGVGQYANLDASMPGASYVYWTWTSSNSAIATVNGGSVRGIAPGTVAIWAIADGRITGAIVTVR